MPPITATGFAAKAMRNLANSTAASATFRALVGAPDAAAALERSIHWPETVDRLLEGEITDPYPRAIIGPGNAGGMRSKGPGHYFDEGVLFWSLELIVPEQYGQSPRDRLTWFGNQYSAVIEEMFEIKRQGGSYLNMLAMLPFEEGGPAPINEDDQQPEITADVWRVIYAVEY